MRLCCGTVLYRRSARERTVCRFAPAFLTEVSKPMFVDYLRRSVMSRRAQKLLVIATLLARGKE